MINDKIIDNNIKLEQYRKYAREILENKGFKVCGTLTPEQNEYIYSYIEYYIEHKNRSKKFEKMRALYGMSKSLLCYMIAIMLICIVGSLLSGKVYGFDTIRSLWLILYSAISMVIHFFRAERCMKYRIRMMMGIYESCIEAERMSFKK